jgi:hypothetical protein
VRAISLTTGIPYNKVYSMLLRAGRMPDQSFRVPQYLDSCGLYSRVHDVRYNRKRIRLFRFIRDHPKGSYLLLANKHTTACIDGVIHDDHYLSPSIYIYDSWMCIKSTT